ncbi:hypothetical protein N0V88_006328 [Collariella sp. IMI 366227]|nr:hypothetical protein N0V88_006328 [Collariella sp. IMI 366227]
MYPVATLSASVIDAYSDFLRTSSSWASAHASEASSIAKACGCETSVLLNMWVTTNVAMCTLAVNKAFKFYLSSAADAATTTNTIMVLSDDDMEWPSTLMLWLLAPFEHDRMGGVGTCQRVKRVTDGGLATRIYNWLSDVYIERRNFEILTTHNVDGGTLYMSGRTGAYWTDILKSHDVLENLKSEKWGRYILNADDDNFITRWLVAHQLKTWIRYEPECKIETTPAILVVIAGFIKLYRK